MSLKFFHRVRSKQTQKRLYISYGGSHRIFVRCQDRSLGGWKKALDKKTKKTKQPPPQKNRGPNCSPDAATRQVRPGNFNFSSIGGRGVPTSPGSCDGRMRLTEMNMVCKDGVFGTYVKYHQEGPIFLKGISNHPWMVTIILYEAGSSWAS